MIKIGIINSIAINLMFNAIPNEIAPKIKNGIL